MEKSDRDLTWDPVSDPWDYVNAWNMCSVAVDEEIRREVERLTLSFIDLKQTRAVGDIKNRDATWTEYRYALQAVSDAALKFANEIETSQEGRRNDIAPLPGLLDRGFSVIRKLITQREVVQGEKPDDFKLWSHRNDIMSDISAGEFRYINSAAASEAVSHYLNLPYRCGHIDRMLVDLLVYIECLTFGYCTSKRGISRWLPTRSVISIWTFAAILTVLGLCVLRVLNNGRDTFAIDALLVPGFIVASVLAEGITLRLRRYIDPTNWLLGEMVSCYRELNSPGGPISARHLIERLRRTSEMGAVWPPAVHALLDDVAARGGCIGL
jgi:hypothetical protein